MATQLEALGRTAWQIILVLGGIQVVLHGLMGWLGSMWMGRALERERAKLARQNEAAAAALKAAFDHSLSATTAALSVFASGHQAAQERRLAAVSALWTELTKARETASPGLVFFDILLPTEYDNALQVGSRSRALVEKLRGSGGEIEKMLYPIFDVDAERPFLPDELYGLFILYRQILGRVMWLLEEGLEKGHVVPWYEDQGLRRIITGAIGAGEFERVTAGKMKSPAPVLALIQHRILEVCQAVVSGKGAAASSLAGAHELAALASEMESKTLQERMN
jgi:hypothetical protein